MKMDDQREIYQQYLGPLLEKHSKNQPIFYEDLIHSWKKVERLLSQAVKTDTRPEQDMASGIHALHSTLLTEYENAARGYYLSILQQDSTYPSLPTDFKLEKLDDYLERCKTHVISIPSIIWAKAVDNNPPMPTGEMLQNAGFQAWRVPDQFIQSEFWIPLKNEATKRYKDGLQRKLEQLRTRKKAQASEGLIQVAHHNTAEQINPITLGATPEQLSERENVETLECNITIKTAEFAKNDTRRESDTDLSNQQTIPPHQEQIHVALVDAVMNDTSILEDTQGSQQPNEQYHKVDEVMQDYHEEAPNEYDVDDDDDDDNDNYGGGGGGGNDNVDVEIHHNDHDMEQIHNDNDDDDDKLDDDNDDKHDIQIIAVGSHDDSTSRPEQISLTNTLTAAQKRILRFSTGNKEGAPLISSSLQSARKQVGNLTEHSVNKNERSTNPTRASASNRGSKRKVSGKGGLTTTHGLGKMNTSGTAPTHSQQGGRGRGRGRK